MKKINIIFYLERAKNYTQLLKYDWMHDTARCLGYPSDSSWSARKRLGPQLAGASPLSPSLDHPHCAASPTRTDVTSATGSAASCGRRCLTHHYHPAACSAVRLGHGAGVPGLSLCCVCWAGVLCAPDRQ